MSGDYSSSLAQYFDLEANQWERKYAPSGSMRKRVAAFTSALADYLPQGSSILDFGCGSGDITAGCLAAGYKPTGIDQASEMVRRARERFGDRSIPFCCLSGSHPELPFAARSFDAFIASSVLEYTASYLEWLRELRRVCVDDGLGLVTVPNVSHPLRALEHIENKLYDALRKYRPKSKIARTCRASYLHFSNVRLTEEEWENAFALSGWRCVGTSGHRTPLLMFRLRSD